MESFSPQTVVTVPYNQWIGYNILKTLSYTPVGSSVLIGAIVGYMSYSPEKSKTPGRDALNAFVLSFLIMYAILWYYGSTLFI